MSEKYCQMYHTILYIVKVILQNGDHFQSNTSISEPKRRRASNVDSMYRFCGAYIPEIVLPNTSCNYIRHFGGHFPKKMAAFFEVIRVIFEHMR